MGNGYATGKVDRLKRRLVQQAVQDNLDLIYGRSLARSARRWRRRSLLRGWILASLLPAVLVSAYAVNVALPEEALARARSWIGSTVTAAPSGSTPPAQTLSAAPPSAAPPSAVTAEASTRPSPGTAPPGEPTVPPPTPSVPGASEDGDLFTPETPPEESRVALGTLPTSIDHAVFPLAVHRIVLDPGHGGPSLGTRTPNGLMEKEVTLDISRRLSRLLAEDGFEVLMTRDEDEAVDLAARASFANEEGADIFVSIHVNWIDDGGTRGVETYFLGTTDDPYLSQLAASENRDSGYSMGDLRRLLDRMVSGVRLGKSQELAAEVQGSLFRSLRKVNPQLIDRGVKRAPFLVLVETEMPAILAEVSCLSNEREAELLAKPLYRQFIAEALAAGIGSYARSGGPAEQKGSG